MAQSWEGPLLVPGSHPPWGPGPDHSPGGGQDKLGRCLQRLRAAEAAWLTALLQEGEAEASAGGEFPGLEARQPQGPAGAPSRPLAGHRALLCQFPTCPFPAWLSLAVNSSKGRGLWGRAGSPMTLWLDWEVIQGQRQPASTPPPPRLPLPPTSTPFFRLRISIPSLARGGGFQRPGS